MNGVSLTEHFNAMLTQSANMRMEGVREGYEVGRDEGMADGFKEGVAFITRKLLEDDTLPREVRMRIAIIWAEWKGQGYDS